MSLRELFTLFSCVLLWTGGYCNERQERSTGTATDPFACPIRDDYDRESDTEVRISVLLPNDTAVPAALSKVGAGILVGVDHARERGLWPTDYKVNVTFHDSKCSIVYAPNEAVMAYMDERTHAFLGPVCDLAVAPVARFLKFWNVPLLTAGAFAHDFGLNKTRCNDEFYEMTRAGFGHESMSRFVVKVMEYYNWKKLMIIYDKYAYFIDSFCYYLASAIVDELKRHEGFRYSSYDLEKNADLGLEANLEMEVGNEWAIVAICAEPDTVRDILLAAENIRMADNGEYVFFSIEYFPSNVGNSTPWFREHDSDENNTRAKKAYEMLMPLNPRTPVTPEFQKFSEEVKEKAKTEFGYDYSNETVNTFVTAFYEAVLLFAYALKDTLAEGDSISNGSAIVERMRNRTFLGITGNVSIDNNNDRNADYSLLDMNPETGIFEVVANYYGANREYIPVPGKVVYWSGGLVIAPPDTPTCGFDRAKCPGEAPFPKYAIVSITLLLAAILMATVSFFAYRHYKLEAELASMNWKIRWEDILFAAATTDKGRRLANSRLSLARHSLASSYSVKNLGVPGGEPSGQMFIKTGFYKGAMVAIKMITKAKIDISRPLLLEFKLMKDLQHDHIVRFIGCCAEPPNCSIFTEYCSKGSLQDILENDQIKLDDMFKRSLVHDLVKGMLYLHGSEVRSHGNLKSSNCVVDSRFVLKVTDFGLHSIRDLGEDLTDEDSYAFWRKKLWTAPELLRVDEPPRFGTQKGDVYSFAIVTHEIIFRQGPFYLDIGDLGPKEIIQKLIRGSEPLLRPSVDSGVCDEEMENMMTRCWSEDQMQRPDFNALKAIVRRLNKTSESGNILDNLLSRMEQYADNLEVLVDERTADYLEEKRKCEEVLYQLLPRSVAGHLIRGETVAAEAFDAVTIYFSDIVGFTALSAESTPMQVVALLNDLYTCFDSIVGNFDVYKVETIGDAYMVVSGLPTRSNVHAREIARMSLALLHTVHTFKIRHRPEERLKLRIGMHSGSCVAGIVGLKMPRYCLFGDTVNTASRMESNGEPLKIHVSPFSKEALDAFGTFRLECRGEVEMKGKGKMTTYWLLGENETKMD